MNKTLISELEDAIRRQEQREGRSLELFRLDQWPRDRQTYINVAANLLVAVQIGDAHAAEKAQDQGADS